MGWTNASSHLSQICTLVSSSNCADYIERRAAIRNASQGTARPSSNKIQYNITNVLQEQDR